jgi:hypothetical protein
MNKDQWDEAGMLEAYQKEAGKILFHPEGAAQRCTALSFSPVAAACVRIVSLMSNKTPHRLRIAIGAAFC